MATRVKREEEEGELLEDDATHATHKRRRLSSPQLDEKPLAEHDAEGRHDDIRTTQMPDRGMLSSSASVKAVVEGGQTQSSTSRHSVDPRTDHNDTRSSAGPSTLHNLSLQFATNDTGYDEEQGSSRTSLTTSRSISQGSATTVDTRRSAAAPVEHAQSGPARWSAADEKALVEFVSRDAILLPWAARPSNHDGRRKKNMGVVESLEQFLKLTPASTPQATFDKLKDWRSRYRTFKNQLTMAGRSTSVGDWRDERDQQRLANAEAKSRDAYQWLRLWHDTIQLVFDRKSAKDTEAASAVAASSSAFGLGSNEHQPPRILPQPFQARAANAGGSNLAFALRPSSNDSQPQKPTNIHALLSRPNATPWASPLSTHAFSPAQQSSSSSSSSATAFFESRLVQLERQNSLLQTENKQQQQQLNQQKSLLDRYAQQIERQSQQMKRLEEQHERSVLQMERLEQQSERLEQNVERQAQALDRNALALERRALTAEREAQKLERLAQHVDRLSQ